MPEYAYPILLAFWLDILLGDPHSNYHPVALMGRWILKPEKLLYPRRNKKLAGFLLLLFYIAPILALNSLILKLGSLMDWRIGLFIQALLVYFSLGLRSLRAKGGEIQRALERGKLEEAGKLTSQIVSRDCQGMEKEEVIPARVESLSENINDAIVAPIFYAIFAGGMGAIIYRAVNTLDAMLGYRNERYAEFGFFPARLDDILNYLPARLSAILVLILALILRKNFKNYLKIILKDARKNLSPYAGYPEAAIAGALGIPLGGADYYEGKRVEKSLIGRVLKLYTISDTYETRKFIVLVSVLLILSAILISFWR